MLADGQAEAGSAEASARGRVGLCEGLEDAGELLGGDADAGVRDVKAELRRPARAGGRLNELHGQRDAAQLREFDRVGEQVQEHLFNPPVVAVNFIYFITDFKFQSNMFFFQQRVLMWPPLFRLFP